MEFVGLYKKMNSITAGEKVYIFKYKSNDSFPYCDCSRCGKPIKRTMYVVQSQETDVELYYLGSDCVKQFN